MSSDEDDLKIPISEWPITNKHIDSNHTEKNDDTDTSQDCLELDIGLASDVGHNEKVFSSLGDSKQGFLKGHSRKRSSSHDNGKHEINHEYTHSSCLENKRQKATLSSPSVLSVDAAHLNDDESIDNYVSIDVTIARWWRRYKNTMKPSYSCLPKVESANTSLYHISRLPECINFLRQEKKHLERNVIGRCNAEIYATLAGIEDRLGNFTSGLESIEQAIQLQPDNPNFLWLREKLRRQCKIVEEQRRATPCLEGMQRIFPPFKSVQRVSSKDLQLSEFQHNYVKQGKPVILTDVVSEMCTIPFDLSLIKAKAGSKSVRVKKSLQGSVEWARLEDGSMKTVNQFVEEIRAGTTSEYLFDWSLPVHCPELAAEISLPGYFKDNLLLKTSPGSLYRESWPSLFVAPPGAVSNLHIDAFASHFWMALFQGEKRWTFFDPKDTALLYPRYFHSLDPIFDVDLENPDFNLHPLLALTQPQQCVLKPGELLFVPAGSPHYVENLSTSLAISSNYVNETNFEKVCQELKINAWQDPRAKDLLEQFRRSNFTKLVDGSSSNLSVNK